MLEILIDAHRAGIRHVKVWRLADAPGSPTKSRPNIDAYLNSPGVAPKALSGRNCLLGPLGEHTFTCIASISDYEAFICSDGGAVCFLDDTEGSQKLSLIKCVAFGITSIAVDSESGTVWLGGRGRKILKLQIDGLRTILASGSLSPNNLLEPGSPKGRQPAIVSMGFLSTHMVTVDSTRAIHVCPMDALSCDDEQCLPKALMPAHRDPVLGVSALKTPNAHDADFFTWSCEGSVNFWSLQGKCQATRKIELEQLATSDDEVANELKVLRAIEDTESFVSGDRYGVLRYAEILIFTMRSLTLSRVLSANPWKCVNEVRAHGAEVTDIAVLSCPDYCLVASSGRDRMVQLFKKTEETFELIQTMDDHVGAVGRLLFMNDGERLLSCSADRTVIIREKATREVDGSIITAFVLSKVITLKVSPVSMTLAPDDPDILILSTIDRQIQRFDVPSARHIHSFRASDPETNDAMVMSSLIVSCEVPGQSPRLLVGVSTTDKSIRVYDFERDTLLAREFGHSEGVSDVLLVESKPTDSTASTKRALVSTGLDGVVMIWDLSVQPQQVQELSQTNIREEDETPAKELTAAKPPLRRILSRSELAVFQRQDSPSGTPTPIRDSSPPRIRRKASRLTLAPPTPKNGNLTGGETPPPLPFSRRSPASTISDSRGRSPSPPSPKSKVVNGLRNSTSISNLRRPSLDFRARTKSSSASEFGSLNMSTEQVCRTLRAYRKKLNGSSEYPRPAKELQRELDLTIHALSEREKRHQANAETENDSSGKENEQKRKLIPGKPTRIARRVPSTPLLGQRGPRQISRTRSLDADGEG
jgi:WD40 repeat protein